MIETEDLLAGRVALSVPEVAELLGLSKSHGYRLAESGELPTVRLGRRLVVPVSAVRQLLDGQIVDATGDHPSPA